MRDQQWGWWVGARSCRVLNIIFLNPFFPGPHLSLPAGQPPHLPLFPLTLPEGFQVFWLAGNPRQPTHKYLPHGSSCHKLSHLCRNFWCRNGLRTLLALRGDGWVNHKRANTDSASPPARPSGASNPRAISSRSCSSPVSL